MHRLLNTKKSNSISHQSHHQNIKRKYINKHYRLKAKNITKNITKNFSSSIAREVGQKIDQNEKTPIVVLLKQFSKYVWPEDKKIRMRVSIALGMLLFSKVLNVQVPYVFKMIVDAMNMDATMITVPMTLLVGYGLAKIGQAFFHFMKDALFASVAQDAIMNLSSSVYLKLLNMDLAFHVNRETGGLARAIDRGTRGISTVLTSMVFHLVPTFLEIVLVSGLLTYSFGWEYAAVTCSTFATYAAFTFIVAKWRMKLRREMNEHDNKAASLSVDALINYETVKYFNSENLENQRYVKSLQAYNKCAVKVQTSLAFLNIGQNAIFSVALVMVMVMASRGIASGALTIGDLVMVNGLIFQLSLPLNFLGSVYSSLRQAFVDMDILFKLTDVVSPIRDNEKSVEAKIDKGEIKFENVSFYYDEQKKILDDVSFTCPGGKVTAVVGTSGGGKTTISRLIYRLYDSKAGTVFIDGQDIRTLKLDSIRKLISVVPQDMALFNESILFNIAYGKPGCTKEDVIKACKLSQIHDTIMNMPNQYDTMVGERGVKLSGGEKQRICIARALLKDPKILILDEITSSLDAESEHLIQGTLKEVTKDRTVIMISHRLKTIQSADNILVLSDGKIIEQGNHKTLYEKHGTYHDLVSKQSLTKN